jgi:uncharacterized damage-inducible protein DinB
MADDFERERSGAFEELEDARVGLLKVVSDLVDADLERARRGGWSVREVLMHVVESDWWFAGAIAALREYDRPSREATADVPQRIEEVIAVLTLAREALVEAADGVMEDAFYRMRKIGPQDYSILSVLENCADHDREHALQVQALVGGR